MNEKSIDEIIVVISNRFMKIHQTIGELYDNQDKNIDWITCECKRKIHRSEWKTHWLKCLTIVHKKN